MKTRANTQATAPPPSLNTEGGPTDNGGDGLYIHNPPSVSSHTHIYTLIPLDPFKADRVWDINNTWVDSKCS